MENLKKYAAEFAGTAALVLIACGTAVFTNVDVVATALAFGLVIVILVPIIGSISGCHVNPAVSLGMLINKKISFKDFWFYVLSQVLGAITGGLILFAIVKLTGRSSVGNMGANGYVTDFASGVHWDGNQLVDGGAPRIVLQIFGSLLVEIVLTFIFVFTILAVTSKKENSKIAGPIIGLTLTLVHLIGIGLTGTSVNPARSIGAAIFSWTPGNTASLEQLWVFIVAPLIGAAIAGFAAKRLFKQKEEAPAETEAAESE